MEPWEKETKERLERLGYKFDGPKTLSKNDAIGIVIKMRSKLGRYTANNRYLAEREIEYLTLVHNITYGDIWDYKKEIKKRKKQTMNFETFDQFTVWAKSLKSCPLGKIIRSSGCGYSGTRMTATFIIKDNKIIYYSSERGWETEKEFKKSIWERDWEKLKDAEKEFISLMLPEILNWNWQEQNLKSPDKLMGVALNKAIKEEVVEKQPCTRCGGTGHYSFNLMHGTMCYGCGGRKWKYPRITKKLIKEIKRRKQ